MSESTHKPESQMMSLGHNPSDHHGAIKPPIYQTSTFSFSSAEEGKAMFARLMQAEPIPSGESPMIYSRLSNPNLEVLEQRLALLEGTESAAAFESGMAAISAALLEFTNAGEYILLSTPCYSGTHTLVHQILQRFNIGCIEYNASDTKETIVERVKAAGAETKIAVVYIESPANPTNQLFDLRMCRTLADHFSSSDRRVPLITDNTYMGPLWSKPLSHGIDIVLYSATKYLAGHSDLVAGAAMGNAMDIKRIKSMRTNLGNMAGPWTAWLLLRSLETLKPRLDRQAANAQAVAEAIENHPAVERICFLGLLKESDPDFTLYQTQYSSGGAMMSIWLKGGEPEAFRVLNALKLIKLAVSLGSTESLAQHPFTMTHCGVPEASKRANDITPNLIRVSIGIEAPEDLINDLESALNTVQSR